MGNVLTGAEIVVESLIKENVKVVFGYQGGSVIPIFDALYKREKDEIEIIIPRHEQAAAHAADGYARATGKVGVCLATSGPGATNLVTGITNAFMDSIPLVAITGQVPTSMIGNDAFQEADMVGITRSITKYNFLVKDVKDLAKTIKEAFFIASTGRPGPVLVDLPKDVLNGKTEFIYPDKAEIRGYKPTYEANKNQIKKMLEMIKHSKRPVIYTGGGIISSEASKELFKFVTKANIPITTTFMGLGTFPIDHPLSLGMPGMHGTFAANMALSECDLLIAIGARFDDRVTGKLEEFAKEAKIIHIDIDPTSVSKNVHVDLPIVGDAKDTLKKLTTLISPVSINNWLNIIENWKKTHPLTYKKEGELIKPQYVIEVIDKLTNDNAIIATEVGQHQMWAAQFYKFKKPRTWVSSGGLGTMGFGFPSGIGAQVGNKNKTVFNIAGDGSIQMNIQELATLSNYNIPLKVIILNNQFLGMVRQWQELFFNKRYSGTYLAKEKTYKINGEQNKNRFYTHSEKYYPDFVKLAEAYGIKGIRISKMSEVEKTIKEIIDYKGPVIVDVLIAKEENVLPMVPAGAPINKMIMDGMS